MPLILTKASLSTVYSVYAPCAVRRASHRVSLACPVRRVHHLSLIIRRFVSTVCRVLTRRASLVVVGSIILACTVRDDRRARGLLWRGHGGHRRGVCRRWCTPSIVSVARGVYRLSCLPSVCTVRGVQRPPAFEYTVRPPSCTPSVRLPVRRPLYTYTARYNRCLCRQLLYICSSRPSSRLNRVRPRV